MKAERRSVRKNPMRTATIKIVATAICLLTAACDGNESAPTPASKPEVWGVILPVPDGDQFRGSYVYESPEGDVIISYRTHLFPNSDGRSTTIFYNFTKGIRLSTFTERIFGGEISWSEASRRPFDYIRYLGLRESKHIQTSKWLYGVDAGYRDKHGNTYYSHSVTEIIDCPPYQGYLEKVDSTGHTVQKMALVQVSRLPRVDTICTSEGQVLGLYRVHASVPELYPLSDGTLLLLVAEFPLMVRVRSDLSSPYIDESDELIWLDADTYARWIEECRREASDFVDYYYDADYDRIVHRVTFHALQEHEITDACLALRLSREIGAKKARLHPSNANRL